MSGLINNAALMADMNPIENIGRNRGKTLESEKARLRHATEEFESFFSYQMLKTMRQTIPKSDDSKNGPFSGDLGKDTWTDMFDMEVSKAMAQTGNRSIADVLYSSLERLVEAGFDQGETKELLPLRQTPGSLKLKSVPINLPEQSDKIDIQPKPTFRIDRSASTGGFPTDTITTRYGKIIEEAAAETKLDSTLIASVIEAESAGNPKAISKAGAKGLMQLMDSTAGDYGVTDSFDPRQNILAGSRFLKRLVDRFGDVETALAAYNAGPGNVDKYGGIPPFSETQKYVEKVTSNIARRSEK